MTTYFISRHPGALAWVKQQGVHYDKHLVHLDDAGQINPGDQVIGTLPINQAAAVCARGGRYFHLSLQLPAELRGQELSADTLNRLNATLEEFRIELIPVAATA